MSSSGKTASDRPGPLVGRNERKGWRMIRKLLSPQCRPRRALSLFVTQTRFVLLGSSARAATTDTYRQLNLFGDVFERVRTDYVEKPDDAS